MKADGVKLLFGGNITQTQLIIIIVALVAIILVVKFAKKIVKIAALALIVVATLVSIGVVSPSRIGDVTAIIKNTGTATFTTLAKASENIKFDTADCNIYIKMDNEWINVQDITKFVTKSDGSSAISIDNKTYSTDDENITKLLEILKK